MPLKVTRRSFIKGLTVTGVTSGLGVWSFNARSSLSLPLPPTLLGTHFAVGNRG